MDWYPGCNILTSKIYYCRSTWSETKSLYLKSEERMESRLTYSVEVSLCCTSNSSCLRVDYIFCSSSTRVLLAEVANTLPAKELTRQPLIYPKIRSQISNKYKRSAYNDDKFSLEPSPWLFSINSSRNYCDHTVFWLWNDPKTAHKSMEMSLANGQIWFKWFILVPKTFSETNNNLMKSYEMANSNIPSRSIFMNRHSSR